MTQEFQKQLEIILNTALNIFQVIATFVVAFLVILWMTLCVWTFRDIQSRTRDIIAQVFATLLVFVFNIPGVLLYILVRPKETLVQSYERSLQEEYMLQDLEEREICPTCRVKTQPDFMFCFNCRSRLRRECSHCTQLIKLKWSSCPFCGTPQKARPRDGAAERTGLGAPRAGQPSRPPAPQPAGTALATSGAASNGNLMPGVYHQPTPAPTSVLPHVQPEGTSQPYAADAGENYNYQQEQLYSYQPQNDPTYNDNGQPVHYNDPANNHEVAPAPTTQDDYEQPSTRRYQSPRQRRKGNGRNPNNEQEQ